MINHNEKFLNTNMNSRKGHHSNPFSRFTLSSDVFIALSFAYETRLLEKQPVLEETGSIKKINKQFLSVAMIE